MYNLFSVICIVLLSAIAIGYIIAIFKKERSKSIEFIRQFKKGKCAIVYLVAIPLYFIGHIYAGQAAGPAFFAAINKTMVLVVLRYDMSSISALMADNCIYTVAVYFCFILVLINAMLLILSLLHQKIWEWCNRLCWNLSGKEKLLIVGNNKESLDIYTSETNRAVMLLDDIADNEKGKLFGKRVNFISLSGDIEDIRKKGKKNENKFDNAIEEYCCKFVLDCLDKPKKPCILVINTKDDYKNIALCQKIVAATSQRLNKKSETEMADVLSHIRIYVFGMPDHEAIYNSIVESAKGCIRYVNKYRQIAMDFVERYPLTQFMTSEQIDYGTSLLKDGVDVNVAMIGFGKTNHQIFLTSVANNQFLVEKDGKKVLKEVNYHIFDKKNAESNKNLNHSYYRFKNEFEDQFKEQAKMGEAHPYLPFPMLPAKDEYYDKHDVNDSIFYKKLKAALSGEKKFNYIIIAFGTDLENIDMAQKMLEKKQEWGLKDTYIFVKVRSGNDSYAIFKGSNCFMIGDEPHTVYNIDQIDDHVITDMAKMRNKIYALESKYKEEMDKPTKTSPQDVYAAADCDWYINKTQFERESNIYACLSLRSKLHLMGLDYIVDDGQSEPAGLDREEYLQHYAGENKPDETEEEIEGKIIIKYDIEFNESRRKTMAIHEHMRWNSFMISKGFVPSSKQEIVKDSKKHGKNYSLRKHGNLTTFEGLVTFRQLIANGDKAKELKADVIKYDYQLLDDAHWLLSKNHYKIVKRDVHPE